MLFLSFAGEDLESARTLAAKLQELGIDVWCSAVEGSIREGIPYRDQIYEGLDRCTVFAVLLGDGPFDGGVAEETDYAIDRFNNAQGFRVVPLRMSSKRELPKALKRFQALDLPPNWREPDDEFAKRVVARLGLAPEAAQPSAAQPQQPATTPRRRSSKRRVFVGIAVLATVVVASFVAMQVAAASSSRAWTEVAERVAKDSRFASWKQRLGPQAGLIPLKPDPVSGLEEFAVQGTGTAPTRDASGRLQIDADSALVMVLIPPGMFDMGVSALERMSMLASSQELTDEAFEGPRHLVTIGRPFFLSRTEVPRSVYDRVMHSDRASEGSALLPADGVSWTDAKRFDANTGLRLPSEAEWEYAARAGTSTAYWSGNDEAALARVDWYLAKGDKIMDAHVHDIGEKQVANGFGLLDVHGNVAEWCEDTFHPSYEGAPADGSAWVEEGNSSRVIRGGAAQMTAVFARSASRQEMDGSMGFGPVGFRPARSVTTD